MPITFNSGPMSFARYTPFIVNNKKKAGRKVLRLQSDVGGLPAGELEIKDDDAPPWAKLMTAFHGAIGSRGHYSIDMMRRTVEGLTEEEYARPYFERWMTAILKLVQETDLLTLEEIEERMAEIKQKIEAARK